MVKLSSDAAAWWGGLCIGALLLLTGASPGRGLSHGVPAPAAKDERLQYRQEDRSHDLRAPRAALGQRKRERCAAFARARERQAEGAGHVPDSQGREHGLRPCALT